MEVPGETEPPHINTLIYMEGNKYFACFVLRIDYKAQNENKKNLHFVLCLVNMDCLFSRMDGHDTTQLIIKAQVEWCLRFGINSYTHTHTMTYTHSHTRHGPE